MDNLLMDSYNRPINCKACGGIMIFKGVGEYACEDCKSVDYDDFGKVRLYIETHRGANAAELEEATGVKQRSIRQMLREHRLQIASDSKTFLKCDICGVDIRSGQLCPKCEREFHQNLEHENRLNKKRNKGVGMGSTDGGDGAKRFQRDY